MTKEQVDYLEKLYQVDTNWVTDDTKTISAVTGLGRVKIYKWHYDRKKQDVKAMIRNIAPKVIDGEK